MSFDFSFHAQQVVAAVQQLTASLEEEVRGAMFDVREAMKAVQGAVIQVQAAGPHFVQVSVSEGSRGGMLAAVDNRGRVWVRELHVAGSRWEQTPAHPELF